MNDLMDLMEHSHRLRYSHDSAELIPFVALIRDGDFHALVMIEDMERCAESIRKAVEETASDGYIFSSEAWMKGVHKDDLATYVPPSQSEERMEALVVEYHTPLQSETRIYEIVRDWTNGKVTELKRIDLGVTLFSRMNIYAGERANVH